MYLLAKVERSESWADRLPEEGYSETNLTWDLPWQPRREIGKHNKDSRRGSPCLSARGAASAHI